MRMGFAEVYPIAFSWLKVSMFELVHLQHLDCLSSCNNHIRCSDFVLFVCDALQMFLNFMKNSGRGIDPELLTSLTQVQ